LPPPALTPTAPASPVFGVDGHLVWQALAATRAAAVAASRWAGRGDGPAADDAATTAMRAVLGDSRGRGTVITGEGAKDDAPMLADGELLGAGAAYDIAVDPLECTDLCAWGLPGALATIALGARGSLWSPGPAYYMDKLILPPRARDAARITDSPEAIVEQVAAALAKEVASVRIVVLDKPRHRDLIEALRATGASVATPSAGDVAGALTVLLPDGEADLLLGVGGTPEGVLAACAVRALGGGMQGRLAPQRDEERRAIEAAGITQDRVLELDDLVASEATFVATGVTGGLLAPPRRAGGWVVTESIVIAAGAVSNLRQSTPTEE
jgi:fructose-1,6-bisphosphatase II